MPKPAQQSSAVQPREATPLAFAQVIVAAYQQRGHSPANALALAQIAPAKLKQGSGGITARQMEILSGKAMQELDDEALGAFSRRLPWGSYGMLARASLGAPDLGVAIKRWCRHHGLLADDIHLKLVVNGESAAIVIEESPALARLDPTAREFCLVHVLRNIHGLACWYVDSRIALQAAHFPLAPPPHVEAYDLMFPGPLHFHAGQASITFDARYLRLPIHRDEKALQHMLQRALPLTVLQYRRDRLLAQQVRQVLANSMSQPQAVQLTADGVAAQLHISVRTLHRQLREEGSSLQKLKDDARRERAQNLLNRTDKPVKQVAAAAGFKNEKSFMRAFQSWTGTSPTEFRSGLRRPGV